MQALNAVGREFEPIETRSIWKGVAAGAMAGMAATVVMTQFQNAWNSIAKPKESTESKGKPVPIAGPAVQYAIGTAVGALYGVASEMNWRFSMPGGLPYGTALPALGLAKGGRKVPLLVYGAALEVFRRGFRKLL